MPSFFNFLRSFDIFGVQITQKYNKEEDKYRSIVGGCTTLVIYMLSAAYALYIVILWGTKELSPKVSTQTYLSDFSLLNLDYDFMKISFWKYNDKLIDPFESNILTVYYYYWTYDSNETTHVTVNRSDPNRFGSPQVAPRMKLEFTTVDGFKTVSSDFYVVIGLCQQEYITDGSKCASKELTDQFFKQQMNNIQMDLKFKRLDPMNEEQQEIIQTLYIQFEEQLCFTQNFYFRTNHYVIRDALLFGNDREYEFIDDVYASDSVNSLNFCEIAFNRTVYAAIYLNLNQMQKLTRYEYDNIGDLLANIGSVVSVLFMAKYLIFSVNSYFHQQSILKSLIDYYYPEFKQIEVIKDWRHRILIVKQGNKYLDINEYIKFRNKMQDIMQTKLSLSNILYELSRITFALRSMQTRDQLRKTHSCGVKLCLPEMEVTQFDFNSEHPQSSRSQSDDNILNEEDCHILSIDERGLFKSRRTRDVESQDFYGLNTIQ